jgi:hypothetical protein
MVRILPEPPYVLDGGIANADAGTPTDDLQLHDGLASRSTVPRDRERRNS